MTLVPKSDIIYANWTQTALLALPFKWLFNKPLFLIYRGTDLRIFPLSINRFIIEKANGVFYWPLGKVGEIQKRVHGRYVKLPIISRVGDYSQQRRTSPDKVKFLFIGRLVGDYAGEMKGVPILLPAFKTIFSQNTKVEMHILGDGPYMQHLIDECTQLQLNEHVFFHGHQQDVVPFLLNSDAVIGAAAMNATAQESAYCGCLLILPNETALTGSIWKDKKNSLLYAKMSSESLAQAMEYVVTNREECQAIARKGNQTIKEYVKDVDHAGVHYLEVFQKIIDLNKKMLS